MAFRVAEAFIQLATRGFDEVLAQVAAIAGRVGDLASITPAVDFSGAAASAGGLSAAVGGVATEMDRLAGSTKLVLANMGQLALVTGRASASAGVYQGTLFNVHRVGAETTAALTSGFKLTTAELGQVLSRLAAVHPLLGRMGSLINGVSFAAQTLGVSLTVATGGFFAILIAIAAALAFIGAAMKTAFAADSGAQALFAEIRSDVVSILTTIGGPLVSALKTMAVPLAEAVDLVDRLLRGLARAPGLVEGITNSIQVMAGILMPLVIGLERLGTMTGLLAESRSVASREAGKSEAGKSGAFVGLEEFAKQLQGGLNKDPQLEEQKKANETLRRIEANTSGGARGAVQGNMIAGAAVFVP